MHLSDNNWSALTSENPSLSSRSCTHNVQTAACFQLSKLLMHFFHKPSFSQALFVMALLYCMDIHSQLYCGQTATCWENSSYLNSSSTCILLNCIINEQRGSVQAGSPAPPLQQITSLRVPAQSLINNFWEEHEEPDGGLYSNTSGRQSYTRFACKSADPAGQSGWPNLLIGKIKVLTVACSQIAAIMSTLTFHKMRINEAECGIKYQCCQI